MVGHNTSKINKVYYVERTNRDIKPHRLKEGLRHNPSLLMKKATTRTKIAFPEALQRYRPLITDWIKTEFAGRNEELYLTHKYYLGWSDPSGNPVGSSCGKGVRPSLALMSAEATYGSVDRTLPIAAALELIHNFSLIHDDIEDGDRLRHHRPTVWSIWGKPAAVISGVALLKIGDLAARRLEEKGVTSEMVMTAQENITRAYLLMIEGQYLDMLYESRESITVEEYLNMIERKTGALIEASVSAGVTVGPKEGVPEEVKKGFRILGKHLGRMFQISDDILGVWGDEKTGKPVGADIKSKKKSLPAVHVLANARGATAKKVKEVYFLDSISNKDIDDILCIMDSLKTETWCRDMAEDIWRNGERVLNSLPINEDIRTDFQAIGQFLLTREH